MRTKYENRTRFKYEVQTLKHNIHRKSLFFSLNSKPFHRYYCIRTHSYSYTDFITLSGQLHIQIAERIIILHRSSALHPTLCTVHIHKWYIFIFIVYCYGCTVVCSICVCFRLSIYNNNEFALCHSKGNSFCQIILLT